jgi:uncharacterized membrane protein HdeD (DUF308 family)
MPNSHSDKYVTHLLLGFSFVIASIFLLMFPVFQKEQKDDWYIWAIVASVTLCMGLYFLVSAAVHKVKADFIKKQRSREMQHHRHETRA